MEIKKEHKLYICIGISGSGKSSHRKRDCLIVSKDECRFMLFDFQNTRRDYILEFENIIEKINKIIFFNCIKTRYNIYLDQTNLTPEKRKFFINQALIFGYEIHFLVFWDHKKAMDNNKIRERKVPNDILKRQIAKFTLPNEYEKSIAKTITFMVGKRNG